MNDRLKDLIFKDITRRVKLDYGNKYNLGNISEVNGKLFRDYGKKPNELVSAIIEFFIGTKFNEDDLKKLILDLINVYIRYGFDFNIVSKYILEDKLDIKYFDIHLIFDVIKATKNKNLIFKIIDNIKNFRIDEVFSNLLKSLCYYKEMGSDPELIDVEIKLFRKLVKGGMDDIVDIVYFMGKYYEKLPTPIKEELKNFIDSLSFEDQTKLSFELNNIPKELFTKINRGSDYTIIGRPDVNTGLTLIRSFDNLYGYINKEQKIIISPLFDEISGINKKGLIRGKINKKRKTAEPGIYEMNIEGKIVNAILD